MGVLPFAFLAFSAALAHSKFSINGSEGVFTTVALRPTMSGTAYGSSLSTHRHPLRQARIFPGKK